VQNGGHTEYLVETKAFIILFLCQGELTITGDMEELQNALFLDQVPHVWTQRAYPSLQGLAAWFADLLLRLRELETWSTDFVVRY
jgi:dynein heavy chain